MDPQYETPEQTRHRHECEANGYTPHGDAVLTLRDRFAMAALTGLLARGAHDHDKREGHRYYELSYEIADGMLEARKPKKP
jgi:hypothetical protein